jgi:tetratricopeptide (TPR) repeat protein
MAGLYTAAMLAELAGVGAWRIRAWQQRGWLVPTDVKHRLAYFDFVELTAARQLASLVQAGAKPRLIERKLAEIVSRYPDIERPLIDLTLVLDGKTLLVRRGGELIETGGQLRIDFDALEQEEEPAYSTIASPAVLLSTPDWRTVADGSDEPRQLVAWGNELSENGDLLAAAEMYRAALAAGGPKADLCFQLAETLYRAGDLKGARERYFMALEIDEDYVEARVNLGCVLLELGEKELAVAAFRGAIESHREYADAHYHLAETLDDLGLTSEATSHWQRFLALAPNSPWSEHARDRLEEA